LKMNLNMIDYMNVPCDGIQCCHTKHLYTRDIVVSCMFLRYARWSLALCCSFMRIQNAVWENQEIESVGFITMKKSIIDWMIERVANGCEALVQGWIIVLQILWSFLLLLLFYLFTWIAAPIAAVDKRLLCEVHGRFAWCFSAMSKTNDNNGIQSNNE
jgi:hypothetical protein